MSPTTRNPLRDLPAGRRFLVLDGGLATSLESHGFDLDDRLWSARLLLEDPNAIRRVHVEFLEAGADCITSASYQATLEGFRERGASAEEARRTMALSVGIARQARDDFWSDPLVRPGRRRPLVAASIGPYGAYLADGSEYSGRYGLGATELLEFHRERWALLAGQDPDLMACETIPSALEAGALLGLIAGPDSPPAWISFSCGDDRHLWDGSPVSDLARRCDAVDRVAAVGINCTAPKHLPSLIREIRRATRKPVLVYPNSGERYDAASKTWSAGDGMVPWEEAVREWHALGASGIGGCCRIGADRIAIARRIAGGG